MPAPPVIDAPPGSWTLTISPDCTVMELAHIMAGIGCRTTGHFLDRGYVQLRPVDLGAPPPTGAQLRDIIQHGVPRLPVIYSRPVYPR